MTIKSVHFWLLLAAAWGFSAGCARFESMGGSMQERMSSTPPRARVVEGEFRQVYEAARLAMLKLGYEFSGGGPAQGRLEGQSRIGGGDDFRSSRQRTISVHLQPAGSRTVEVQVLLTEIIEESFSRAANPATATPVRDPTGYDVFFDELERQLHGRKGE